MKRLLQMISRWFKGKKKPVRRRRTVWGKLHMQPLEQRLVMAAELVADMRLVGGSDPQNLIVVGDNIYFTADDGQNGRELWRSNGSLGNAAMVTDIRGSGPVSSNPQGFFAIDNTLYFTADDGSNGRELWSVSSGGGAQMVSNIAGTPGVGSNPASFTNVNGTLYFSADDGGTNGRELWFTTGSSANVIDIRPGSTGSFPTGLANVNGDLFFGANDGSNIGSELMVLQKGAPRAVVLLDINPGQLGSNPSNGANVANQYFFYATDGSAAANELWVSNGTATGTHMVEDLNNDPYFNNGQSEVQQITDYQGQAYFSAIGAVEGRELWVSATGGSALVYDVATNGTGQTDGDSDPAEITVAESLLFFSADTQGNQTSSERELFVISTAGGPFTNLDIVPGTVGSDPQFLTNADGALYFAATDVNGDREIWRSGGSSTNTVLDTNVKTSGSSNPTYLAYYNGFVYFSADGNSGGRELYRVAAVLPNFAPVLNNSGNPFLTSIAEDNVANNGTDIATLIASATTVNMITDADVNARQGIAITAADTTNGRWEFSTSNGVTWTAFPTNLSDTKALLLAVDTILNRVRFVPNADYFGTVTNAITFRAWDQFKFRGSEGLTHTTLPNGGSQTFSSATETASITVTPVGDVPVYTNAPTVPEDIFSSLFQVIPANIDGTSMTHFQVTGIPNGAQLTDFFGNPINNSDFITVATAAAGLRFQGALNYWGPVNLTFRATPTGSTVGLGTPVNVPITVTPVADLPNVTYPTVITPITTTEDTQTAAGGIRLNRSAVDGNEITHFLISNITNGSIINPTTLQPTSGSFSVTYAQAQAGLTFVPAANYNGTATFQFQAAASASGAGASSPVLARVVVTPVNDAPVNTLPATVVARKNTVAIPANFAFTGPDQVSVADVDVSTGSMTVNLQLSGGGVLNVTGSGVSGNGTANISMSNVQISTLNARLSTLVFTPTQNFTGSVTLTMITSDGGNTGAGGTLFDTDTIVIDVQADNIPPVFTSIPGLQTINEDTPRLFAPGNSNAIQISDADAGSASLDVTLTTAVGKLLVSATPGVTVTNNGTANLTISGSQANLNTALNSLTFTPTLDYFGTGAIDINVNDKGNRGYGGPRSTSGSIPLSITSVNDAPVNTLPGAKQVAEGLQLTFDNEISISDVDLGTSAQIRVILNAPNGKVSVQAIATVVITGQNTSTVTLQGDIANVNQSLAHVAYDANLGYTGNELLTMTTNDLNTTLQGSGGAKVDVDTCAITIININRPPVNTVPGTQAILEDQVLAFSTANGNAISITDVDAGTANISVVLTANNGSLQLGSTAGLTTVTGNNSGSITILGRADLIATALNTLSFTPTLNYFGTASIVIASDDRGNTGIVDPLRGTTDRDTVLINIASVNDPPVQIIPATQDTGLNTPVVFNSTNANLVQVTDVDAGDDQLLVNLSVTNGKLTLGDDRFLGSLTGNGTANLQFTGNLASLNFAMAGMVFTSDVGFIGDAVVTMTTNDQSTTGGAAKTDTDTMVIRVRNLIEISGNTMYVTGTSGNDVMSLVFSSTTAYTVNINGSTQTGNTSTVNNIRFAGGLGNDTLTITDSSLASSAVFTPFGLQMTSSGYTVNALTTETIIVGGSATDTATFNDSAGDDTVNVAPTVSFMTGAGGFRNQVNGFGKVNAIATTGNDKANLTDGSGDDKFTAFPTYAVFTGPGVDYYVAGFDQVAATGTTGTDTAIFVDSAGNDIYTARPTLATLQGPGYLNSAANFDKTYSFVAAANVSGVDQAYFYDSAGNDIFYGVQTYSIMYSAAYYNQATGFDNCVATATLGVDNAVMFDTTANDIVLADSTFMRLTAATLGISYEARGFDQATVFSSKGGTDKATFNDSAGVDKYYGLITHSAMVGPGYFIQAYGFADVRAVSSRGGNDVAILYGSTGNDTLTGAGNAAQVRYQNNRITGVSGFRTVQAIANRTRTDRDRRSIGAITYSLQVYGNWPF